LEEGWKYVVQAWTSHRCCEGGHVIRAAGSEFFFQLKGNMELPTVQKGERKLVRSLRTRALTNFGQ